MTTPTTATGMHLDFDTAVWLAGPPVGTTADEIARWVVDATAACMDDFDVTAHTAQAGYLHEVLNSFATAELACDFRFIRLRALNDIPLIARLNIIVDTPLEEVLAATDPTASAPAAGGRWYERAPQTETLDEQRGLERRTWFAVDDGGIRPHVRHHRRVEAYDVDLVLSCAAHSLRAVAAGMADLDALARGISIVDENGAQW